MTPTFVTDRLLAREMTLDDLDVVAAMLADPDVMRHYPSPLTHDESESWVNRAMADYRSHGHGRWLILDRLDGSVVGQVGLIPRRHEGIDSPEVVWMVDRPCWRRGLAVEAAGATLDLAFDRFAHSRVIALIRPENVASVGVAEKLRMSAVDRIVHAGLDHLVYEARPDARVSGAAFP